MASATVAPLWVELGVPVIVPVIISTLHLLQHRIRAFHLLLLQTPGLLWEARLAITSSRTLAFGVCLFLFNVNR